jgi:hypothetical protein
VKNCLLIFLIILTGLSGKAQLAKNPVIIETKIHSGIAIPLFPAITYLFQDNIYAFDICASFPTYGNDYWEKLYNYPRSGIGYSYWSLGNDEVIGKAHVIYGFLNIPVVKRSGKFSLNYQISLGGAYFPKVFDVHENPFNRAIGSHTNIYARFGLDGKFKLSPSCEIVLEAGTTHFSNGKTKSPNYGINVGSVSVGLNYLFGKNDNKIHEPEAPVTGKKFVQTVLFSAGSKVYDNLLGKRYLTSSVSYNVERLINHKKKIGLGADFFYDSSIREALAAEDGTPEKDFSKLIRVGLHGSYTVQYKKLIAGIQIGNYLYSKYTILTRVYSRLSVQYKLPKNLIASVSVKSHRGKADCLEWGIGYCW